MRPCRQVDVPSDIRLVFDWYSIDIRLIFEKNRISIGYQSNMNRVIELSSWAQRADKEDTIRFHRHSTHLSKGTKYYDTNACCFKLLGNTNRGTTFLLLLQRLRRVRLRGAEGLPKHRQKGHQRGEQDRHGEDPAVMLNAVGETFQVLPA